MVRAGPEESPSGPARTTCRVRPLSGRCARHLRQHPRDDLLRQIRHRLGAVLAVQHGRSRRPVSRSSADTVCALRATLAAICTGGVSSRRSPAPMKSQRAIPPVAVEHLPPRQGLPVVGVAQHRAGLPVGADEVLALGWVHGGPAADAGVHLREQRGRQVHHRHPAVEERGGETYDVRRGAAADGDDPVRPCPGGTRRPCPPRRHRTRGAPLAVRNRMPGRGIRPVRVSLSLPSRRRGKTAGKWNPASRALAGMRQPLTDVFRPSRDDAMSVRTAVAPHAARPRGSKHLLNSCRLILVTLQVRDT